jgi:phospho-2-dehydro-3-deoxyheptonate aldolase
MAARVMVDCSHAQTNKDYTRQPAVLRALIDQIAAGNRLIMGVMLESDLEAGNQKMTSDRSALRVSITAPLHRLADHRAMPAGISPTAGRREIIISLADLQTSK